jgi:hypothetical protein
MLRYGYDKPQFLPSVYSFIRGDNWYSCTEVEELRRFRIAKPESMEVNLLGSASQLQVKPDPRPKTKPEVTGS